MTANPGCQGIEAELLERHLEKAVIQGRVDIVKDWRIIIQLLDELRRMLQEDVTVDAPMSSASQAGRIP